MPTAVPDPLTPALSEPEFRRLAAFFAARLGFEFPASKRALLAGRLSRRLHVLGLPSYAAYWEVLTAPEGGQ